MLNIASQTIVYVWVERLRIFCHLVIYCRLLFLVYSRLIAVQLFYFGFYYFGLFVPCAEFLDAPVFGGLYCIDEFRG